MNEVWRRGLWSSNPALVQLLGLCPLLAVSNTVINGLGLGLATIATLVISNLSVSLLRKHIAPNVRIPVYVLIIAAIVSSLDMLMNAWLHALYLKLGIFIPLIVTNCAIIGRAEAFAARNPPLVAAVDGLAMGTGFSAALIALGALREVLGRGQLFGGAELLFGPAASDWTIEFSSQGWLLMSLPPGAFLGLALLVAAKNAWDQRHRRRAACAAPTRDGNTSSA
nr:electron transport complex subunit E [Oceanococcus sp. HetDA_MAG_MS8]